MKPRLLIVDDEHNLLQFLELLFEEAHYDVTTADGVQSALERLDEAGYDLVLCDLTMPDGSGIDVLREVQTRDDQTSVIMMTAFSSAESAIEAMKAGAYDYVTKPFDVEELKLLVRRALEQNELYQENHHLRQELQGRYVFSNIIGRSGRMQSIFRLIERIATAPSTVLVRGDSGTGKELIARAIHYNSPRSHARFLSINCGALPESLLESELFGHERGAFTGALKDKNGLFQEASGGTLFLDEIGEMTPAMQVKLLRALQEKTIRKVGGTREEPIDVRIICATNQDLEEQLATGDFREDLFYRINVIPIHLPPLRQRREDIPLLVDHFVAKYSAAFAIEPVRFSVEAMRRLESHEWPGNVRELENVIERLLALQTGEVVASRDLPASIGGDPMPHSDVLELPEGGLDLEVHLEHIRRELMAQALERCDGVQTQAAELLGMSFRSFRYYAKKVDLTREEVET